MQIYYAVSYDTDDGAIHIDTDTDVGESDSGRRCIDVAANDWEWQEGDPARVEEACTVIYNACLAANKENVSTTFKFDGSYGNYSQVHPFMADYMRRFEELAAAGQYPYNDSFKGHVPGIAGPCEDTAIYLMQGQCTRYELEARLAEMRGMREIDAPPSEPERFSLIVHCGFFMGGTGYREWMNARLVDHNGYFAVLGKGKRTHGELLLGGKVLVRK